MEYKFKKGDRIKVTRLNSYLPIVRLGDTGTVQEDESLCPYVVFDRMDANVENDKTAWVDDDMELLTNP